MSAESSERSAKYSDIVYEMLKRDILSRKFEPKDKLSETALAKSAERLSGKPCTSLRRRAWWLS